MKRYLILSVDDHDINRYLRRKYLTAENFDVVEGKTGVEALRLAVELQPDLVLLDINLPDMEGTSVCQQIKNDPRTQGIMVLQISASAVGISDAVRGLEGGADGYLIEPVEPELLIAHVRSLLRLRDSEQALRRLNDRLQQFAYLASHDLQEPLRVIMLYSQMLDGTQAKLNEHERMLLSRVTESATRMHVLLKDLLSYSKASAMELEVHPLSLGDCYEGAVSALEIAMSDIDVQLTCDPLPRVEGDVAGLTQVFQNLLGNALKYRKGSTVRIHVSAQKGMRDVVVSVADNGQGFRPEYADQIFGVFKRLHGKDTPGTGIGLALCRAIVERHGGRIWAEAEEGVGATFYFTIPAATDASESATT